MSRNRVRLVYALLALLVGGHVHEMARQQEHWPFSNYPMWARPTRDWHVKDVVAVGVTADPSPREVSLMNPRFTAPLSLYYLRFGVFRRHANQPRTRDVVLRDYLKVYKRRRREGAHGGPELRAVRLYECHWTMSLTAHNAKSPDRTTLICETVAGCPSKP